MAFGVGGQWRQTERRADDGALPILFDPSFRDAMQGGSKWKRFVRVEETSDGVVVSADTLLLRLWHTLWGKGYQYRYSTEHLQHIHKMKSADGGTSEPFKLFCNHVVVGQIRSENLDQKALHEAMQLLLGLKFINNFSRLTGSSIEEVSSNFADLIREKDIDVWKIAVGQLKTQLRNKEWVQALGCNAELMRLMVENCSSLHDVDCLIRHLIQSQEPLNMPIEYKIPYTIQILEEMVDLKSSGFEKRLREYFGTAAFANIVFSFKNRLNLCPNPITVVQKLLVFDVIFRAYQELDDYSVDISLSVLVAVSQLDTGDIEKIKKVEALERKLAPYPEFKDSFLNICNSCHILRL